LIPKDRLLIWQLQIAQERPWMFLVFKLDATKLCSELDLLNFIRRGLEALNHDHVWGLCPAHEKQTGLFHARREGSRDRSGKATEASSAWLSSASRQSSLTGWILQKLEIFIRLFSKTLGSFSMAFA
jgi:hypothetical protein